MTNRARKVPTTADEFRKHGIPFQEFGGIREDGSRIVGIKFKIGDMRRLLEAQQAETSQKKTG